MTSEETEPPGGLDDLDRIVASLKKHDVEFMIVGGMAVIYHGYVRNTKDLDIFIRRTEENAKKTVAAVKAAGFGWAELDPKIFTSGKGIIVGEPPMRFDIISDIKDVRFEDAWERCKQDNFGHETVSYIGLEDLIRNKRAVGRTQDLLDLTELEAIRERERLGLSQAADNDAPKASSRGTTAERSPDAESAQTESQSEQKKKKDRGNGFSL